MRYHAVRVTRRRILIIQAVRILDVCGCQKKNLAVGDVKSTQMEFGLETQSAASSTTSRV